MSSADMHMPMKSTQTDRRMLSCLEGAGTAEKHLNTCLLHAVRNHSIDKKGRLEKNHNEGHPDA